MICSEATASNMTRSHGRCPKGERLRMGFPHGYRKTTTLVAGLRMTGMVAPMVPGGPINGDWFEAYVTQVLMPELRPGDVVIPETGSGQAWITCRATNAQQCGRKSRRRAQPCASCRPRPSPGQALQPGLQPHRKSVLAPQGHAAQSGRTNRQRPMGPHRQARRHLPA